MTERCITQSLKDFLKLTDATTDITKNTDILVNYWKAIYQLCPEAARDPEEYPYLWNTAGIYVLHLILPTVMELAKGTYTTEKFKKILKPLTQMKDEHWQENGELKGIGGLGGFNKIANEMKADLVFEH